MPDEKSIPYTVIGGASGPGARERFPLTVILLDRGGHLYRPELFDSLDKLGLRSVISIEEGPETGDASVLSQRFPAARFIVLNEKASPGARINIGMRECSDPFALVLWSDMRILSAGLSSRFSERLSEQNRLCSAPYLQGQKGELLPCATAPAFEKQNLRLIQLPPQADGARTVYPFDFAGIYSKSKFILSGGFDSSIASPYWQKLDFGFRAWLWGEEIRLIQALPVAYMSEPAQEDQTVDSSYRWFWLKNLAPSYRSDGAVVPRMRYWSYLRSRGGNPFAALSEFNAAAQWVHINRYRFHCDAPGLVDLWEDETHELR